MSGRKHHLEAVKVISAKVYWHLWSHIHFAICVTWQGSACGHHGAPANTTHSTNVGPMLAHRLRRLPTIDPTLILCCFPIKSVLIGRCATANMPNICLKLVGCVVFARCSPGYFQYSLVAADYKEKYHVSHLSNLGCCFNFSVLEQDTLPLFASLHSGVNEYLEGLRWQCVR